MNKLAGIAGAGTGCVASGVVGFAGGVKETGGAENDVGVLLSVVVGGVKAGGGGAAAAEGANKFGVGAEFGGGGNPVKLEDAEELNTFDWGGGFVGSAVGGFENIEVGCDSAGFAKTNASWVAGSLEAAENPWNALGFEKTEEAGSVGADAAPVAELGNHGAAGFCDTEDVGV